jgi:glutathione S-transferase
MRFMPLTAERGPWPIAPVQHQLHSTLCRTDKPAQFNSLSDRLGDADWLDGAFSAGDLMMVSVLLRLKSSGILDEYPNLVAYVARGESRPSYKRAFDAQLAVYTGKPTG